MTTNMMRFAFLLLLSNIYLCSCADWDKWWPGGGGQTTKAPLNLACGVGLTPIDDQMNGTRDANIGEISWQVSVQSKDGGKWAHSCGGVVINNNYVLTTAQCAGGGSNNEAFCRSEAGIVDLPKGGWARRKRQAPTYPGQQTPGLQYTMKTVVHPDFDKITLNNNLALLALAQPFDVDKAEGKINSICLPAKEDHSADQHFVTGWGTTEGVINPKPKLQIVKTQVVSCEPDAQPVVNQLCVVQDLDDSVEDCVGDYGGPLFATNGNTSTLIGIYSSGNGCGLNNTSKFIDIKPYLVWIRDNSKPVYE